MIFMLLMNNKIKTGGFLNSLKKREQILSSYDDEYITSLVRNLYSSSDTYIIKDLLCELFLEDISDRIIEKFLEVKNNISIDEFISVYKETIGENSLSFLLSFQLKLILSSLKINKIINKGWILWEEK